MQYEVPEAHSTQHKDAEGAKSHEWVKRLMLLSFVFLKEIVEVNVSTVCNIYKVLYSYGCVVDNLADDLGNIQSLLYGTQLSGLDLTI